MSVARLVRAGSLSACLVSVSLMGAGAAWSEASVKDEGKHLGVATCASSVCHGRVEAAEHSYADLNEYRVWATEDRHAGAYRTLQSETSKRIAANMGLEDASSAPECLTCHSDYVERAQRGESFHLSDGVGCEACHGGAENWIDTHYGPEASRAANLRAGMQPTDDPHFQARLCQSCHLGDEERFAGHEMMAAGHPRLRFELDTWLTLMPPHHVEDADYQQRKGHTLAAERWVGGVVVAAGEYLALLQRHLESDRLVPELAVFDCHACHRPMDGPARRPDFDRFLPAGALRINDSSLRILAAVAQARSQELGRAMTESLAALSQAAAGSAERLEGRLHDMRRQIDRLSDSLTKDALSIEERSRLTDILLARAAGGQFRDYADAEQLFLALQLLAIDPLNAALSPEIYNGLYALLADEQTFDAVEFADEARRLRRAVPEESAQ